MLHSIEITLNLQWAHLWWCLKNEMNSSKSNRIYCC